MRSRNTATTRPPALLVRLSSVEEREALHEAAAAEDLTAAQVVRRLIREYLADQATTTEAAAA